MKLLERNHLRTLKALVVSTAAIILMLIAADAVVAQSGCPTVTRVAELINEREELENKPTPMDDPNTNDIVKAEREWRAWGKAERERSIKWLKTQVAEASPCWVRYAKSGKKDLKDAYLNSADLHDLDLSGTDLRGAALDQANLKNADLRQAKLQAASVRAANLTNAKLDGAILTDATVSTFSTKGVNFDDWKARGGLAINY